MSMVTRARVLEYGVPGHLPRLYLYAVAAYPAAAAVPAAVIITHAAA